MPRPRKVSDDDVFRAAFRVMQRVGPADFTLEAIAREVGVTSGALVQRFGSKSELMVRLAEEAANATPSMLAEIRARHRSPVAALREYAACMADLATSPDAYVRSLAYLLDDLSDPSLRTPLERHQRATRDALQAMVRDAIAHGELSRSTNAATLARLIESLLGGSLLMWAVHRGDSAATWLRRDLDALLTPYRRKARDDHRRTRTQTD
jgi:AcrR family transcriptional regulator